MQLGSRAVNAKLYESDALEAQTDDETLLRVLVTFFPDAPFRFEQFTVLVCEAIEAGAADACFALDDKAQADGQLAESLLVGFDGGETRYQIALAVGRAARVELAVRNGRGKRPG